MYDFANFSGKANAALNNAVHCAEDMGHTYVGSEHILAGMLSDSTSVACVMLAGEKVTYQTFYEVIKMNVGIGVPTSLSEKDFTPRAKKIISDAVNIALSSGESIAGTLHLLKALLKEKQCFACRALVKMGVSFASLQSDDPSKTQNLTRQHGSRQTALEKYGRNLTSAALSGKLDPVHGRDREIDRVIRILCRKAKNNPCLIGEPGVGKTAVAEGLAIRTAAGTVPEKMKDAQIISLDLASMVAGAKYRGDFEERIRNAVNEAMNDKNVILFIDEIHNLCSAGSAEGAVDAANILKPVLARGEVKLIGATTPEEYRKNIEKDAALERRFQTVSVEEPSRDEALEILFSLRETYENFHGVKITDEALTASVDMSMRYIPDRFLPDKAIDLIDEASAGVNICKSTCDCDEGGLSGRLRAISSEKIKCISEGDFDKAAQLREEERKTASDMSALTAQKKEKDHLYPKVQPSHIAECVSLWTGIPVGKLCENDREKLLSLEDRLSGKIIGQNQAVSSVCRALRRSRAGVSRGDRPVCTFLFSGPTGVGKTALAKALAGELFSGNDALIRLDMSEFSEKHSVSRLIGSPPGYQGFDEGGQLVNRIRRMPYCVILFDEIEKAHPDVFNFLLPVLEDGFLTASDGKRADCRNAVIIMTSNAGSFSEANGLLTVGFSEDSEKQTKAALQDIALRELKRTFSPEFRGRIDETVFFSRLDENDAGIIAENMLKETAERLSRQGIELVFSEGVTQFLVKKGFSSLNGARNLRRSLTNEIESPVADAVINGARKIVCSVREGELVFEH